MINRLDRLAGANWWMNQARQAALESAPPVPARPRPRASLRLVVSAQDDLPRYAGMSLTEWHAVVRRARATGAYRYPPHVTPPPI